MAEVETKNVLIIDDNEKMAAELKDALDRLSRTELPLPPGFAEPISCGFDTHICLTHESVGEYLKRIHIWDVFVIDCRFGEGHYAIPILQSLLDLRQRGVKIVWTAYPIKEDFVACMRLGAWAYLDKTEPKYSSTFMDVIVNIICGLEDLDARDRRHELALRGSAHVERYYSEILRQHKGHYVAFAPDANSKWGIVAEAETLGELYVRLQDEKRDRNSVYIEYVR